MTEIFTAKTVDEAKALAAKKFGKDIRAIQFEIVDEGKKGVFGTPLFFPPFRIPKYKAAPPRHPARRKGSRRS